MKTTHKSKFLIKILCVTMVICMLTSINAIAYAQTNEFDYLSYDDKAVTEYSDGLLDRVSTYGDYISNQGYDDTCLYISPHWEMCVNGKDVPVYGTLIYDSVLDTGVVQSFQYIFSNLENGALNIELSFKSGEIENFCALPESTAPFAHSDGKTITAVIKRMGTYTFLINDDSQEYAITVFVRENKNEDKEIEYYKSRYGAENVIVCEKGFYDIDTIPKDGWSVIYLKRGAFFSVNRIKTIRSEEDQQNSGVPGFLNMSTTDPRIITGYGMIDFNKVDRGERSLFTFSFCKNLLVEDMILLNPNAWTFMIYACEGCRMNDITIFGYRTNSDGINVCNSNNIEVENCFIRNGDDCFSVKTMSDLYPSHDITFYNCIGWSCKARCFGITGEVESDIYNILFKNCAVINRNSTWDNYRIASLCVVVETGRGNIDNVVFEDIEIHHDKGRAMLVIVYDDNNNDCVISGVRFKNISCTSDMDSMISTHRFVTDEQNEYAEKNIRWSRTLIGHIKFIKKLIDSYTARYYDTNNRIYVALENVTANGVVINEKNYTDSFDINGYTDCTVARRRLFSR